MIDNNDQRGEEIRRSTPAVGSTRLHFFCSTAGLLVLIFSSSCLPSQNGWRSSASLCNVGGCLRFGRGYPKGLRKYRFLYCLQWKVMLSMWRIFLISRQGRFASFPRRTTPRPPLLKYPLKQTYSLKRSEHKLAHFPPICCVH